MVMTKMKEPQVKPDPPKKTSSIASAISAYMLSSAVHMILIFYVAVIAAGFLVMFWLAPREVTVTVYWTLVGFNGFMAAYVILEAVTAICVRIVYPPTALKLKRGGGGRGTLGRGTGTRGRTSRASEYVIPPSIRDPTTYPSENPLSEQPMEGAPLSGIDPTLLDRHPTLRSMKDRTMSRKKDRHTEYFKSFKPIGYERDYAFTVIIAAYLPNEQDIILDTLNHFLNNVLFPCEHTIVLSYNTPTPLDIEADLAALELAFKFRLRCVRVEKSTSKAENVNHILASLPERNRSTHIVSVFDADHRPYPDAFVTVLEDFDAKPYTQAVQGRCIIRNSGDSFIARMVDVEFDMIYNIFHVGFNGVHAHGLFGGSNGHWRAPALTALGMDGGMLTEDIDLSIRALANNVHITYDHRVRSDELAPTTLSAYVKQRGRWAQGWFQVTVRRSGWACYHARNWWVKFGLWWVLVMRELSFHIQAWITAMTVIGLIAQKPSINAWILVPIISNLIFLMILLASARHTGWAFVFFLLFFFYLYLQGYIALISEIKELIAISKWVVTARSGKEVKKGAASANSNAASKASNLEELEAGGGGAMLHPSSSSRTLNEQFLTVPSVAQTAGSTTQLSPSRSSSLDGADGHGDAGYPIPATLDEDRIYSENSMKRIQSAVSLANTAHNV